MTDEYTSTIKLRTIPAGRTGFAARRVEALAAKLEAEGVGHAATRVRLVAAANAEARSR